MYPQIVIGHRTDKPGARIDMSQHWDHLIPLSEIGLDRDAIVVWLIAKFIHPAPAAQGTHQMLIEGDVKDIGDHCQTLGATMLNRLQALFDGAITGIIGEKPPDQGKASTAQRILNGRLGFDVLGRPLIGVIGPKQERGDALPPNLLAWKGGAHEGEKDEMDNQHTDSTKEEYDDRTILQFSPVLVELCKAYDDFPPSSEPSLLSFRHMTRIFLIW